MRESPMGMSQISRFSQCERSWAFKYILGWLPPDDQISEPLIYGQCIHLGKEEFYLTHSVKKALKKSIAYLRETQMPDDVFEHCYKKAKNLWNVWPKVFGLKDLETFDIIGIEYQGDLELPNGIKTTVRLDLLPRERETGNIYIYDTKTTKRTAGAMLSDYYMKGQPKLYCAWLMEEKPEFRSHFRGWVTDVVSQRDLKAGLTCDCVRSSPVYYTDEQIMDALITFAIITDTMSEKIKRVVKNNEPINHVFSCNYNACRAYYRTCPYYEFCHLNHGFGDLPPKNKFALDPWVKDMTVLKEFL